MPKVIIIDDNKITADLLSEQLSSEQIKVVGKADTGKSGVQLCKLLEPDFVLYGMNALELDLELILEEIKKHSPKSKVILLTDYDINFEIDIFGICKKSYPFPEILEFIRKK
ncbi:MAG: response regulator [Nitrosopumilaceae archaeon]